MLLLSFIIPDFGQSSYMHTSVCLYVCMYVCMYGGLFEWVCGISLSCGCAFRNIERIALSTETGCVGIFEVFSLSLLPAVLLSTFVSVLVAVVFITPLPLFTFAAICSQAIAFFSVSCFSLQ